jgi:hypothetical protein
MRRVHELAAVAWSVVAGGAGLGFLARDLLGLPGAIVALAWLGGAVAAGLATAPRPPRRPPV